jgi:hypothetical protein
VPGRVGPHIERWPLQQIAAAGVNPHLRRLAATCGGEGAWRLSSPSPNPLGYPYGDASHVHGLQG